MTAAVAVVISAWRCAASSAMSLAPSPARATTCSTAPAFRLGQLTRPDDATLADVESYLLDAALAAGLTEREALATIDSGLRAGHQHPR